MLDTADIMNERMWYQEIACVAGIVEEYLPRPVDVYLRDILSADWGREALDEGRCIREGHTAEEVFIWAHEFIVEYTGRHEYFAEVKYE